MYWEGIGMPEVMMSSDKGNTDIAMLFHESNSPRALLVP
jgi:hypothetical protein